MTRGRAGRRHARRGAHLITAACLAATLLAGATAAAELSLERLGGGSPLTEADLAQGPVVLVVWVTWSPRHADIVDKIIQIDKRWSRQARVLSVVFQEESQTVRRFLEGKGLETPVYLDSGNADFSKQHGVTRLPWLVVLYNGVPRVSVALPDDPHPLIAGAVG